MNETGNNVSKSPKTSKCDWFGLFLAELGLACICEVYFYIFCIYLGIPYMLGNVGWWGGGSGAYEVRVLGTGVCTESLVGAGTDGALTTDHKPDHPDERARITRTGGEVKLVSGVAMVRTKYRHSLRAVVGLTPPSSTIPQDGY